MRTYFDSAKVNQPSLPFLNYAQRDDVGSRGEALPREGKCPHRERDVPFNERHLGFIGRTIWCLVRYPISRLDEGNDCLGVTRPQAESDSDGPVEARQYALLPLFRMPMIYSISLVTEREKHASELARKNWLKLSTNWRPGLLSQGYDEETVDRWIAKAQEEIRNMRPHTYVGVSSLDLVSL